MKKEMLINVLQPEECRIAIVEDGVLEELYVERTSHESYIGNIYKGKIVNLEPAIQAAFVDFSIGRNGFLHVSDVEPRYYRGHLTEDSEFSPRDRYRDPRLEGDAPRRSRDDRPRGPEERERPDQAMKRRGDSKRRRRFGEGLADEVDDSGAEVEGAFDEGESEASVTPPPPPPPPSLPSSPPAAAAWEASTEAFPGEASRAYVEEADEAPWSREAPEDRSIDTFLPESRTHGGRPAAEEPPSAAPGSAADRPDSGEDVWGLDQSPRHRQREPRGRRGMRGRPPRSRERSAPPAPADESPGGFEERFEAPAPAPTDRPEPPFEMVEPEAPERDRPPSDTSEPPRRRGGRSAIRSRGGDRERPREPRAGYGEPRRTPRASEPSEAGDEPGSDLRPHARAGEPGYVPRRERSIEPPEGVEPSVWSEAEFLASPEEGAPDVLPDEPGESKPRSRHEGPRGRRRRRGRRRDRDPIRDEPLGDSGFAETLDDAEPAETDIESETEPRERFTPRPAPRGRSASAARRDSRTEDADFDDDDDIDSGAVEAPEREEAIDPEIIEEIRREIEEIAELEREMGIKSMVEARPRTREERPSRGAGPATAKPPRGRGVVKPPIQEVFRRGDEILVQVIKESIGTKGPTLSTYISIPGRYLVLMPGLNRVGVSRKIADEAQRRRLRRIMLDLNPPKGLGFIVRTAGLDRSKSELARDLAYLLRLWKAILRRIRKTKAPAPIYQESDMITRTIRDIFTSEIDMIWIDERNAFERAQEFMRNVMPRYVDRIRFYDDRAPLFYRYGIEQEIAKIQRRNVPLAGGGSIVIDQTEALVAIDVNSGNFRVENDAERTAYEMNIRAAKEIARQLRLRDLGGVIVNDFIDMRDEKHRRGVERTLREAVRRDRARTKILRISPFGIIEMTRQRIRPSLKRSVFEDCPHCVGAGVVKTTESMAIDVMRLLALSAHRGDIRRVNISVSSSVANYLNNRKRQEIARMEGDSGITIHIRHEEGVPAEHLQIDGYDIHNTEIRLLPAPQSAVQASPRVR